MNYFIFLVMLLFAVYGFLALFCPAKEKKIVPKCINWIPKKGWGFIDIVLALFLWFSSGSVALSGGVFIKFLAIMFLAEGVMLLFVSEKKINTFVKWWVETPPFVVRFFGVLSLIVALFIFRLL